MTLRSLDLLDLPTLSRFQRDLLPLDTARLLTRGNPLGPATLISKLTSRSNLYTAVASQDGDSLMGQVTLKEGESSARLSFLAPADNVEALASLLLEHLVKQAGEWGAFHLLAEVDEQAPAFRSLRQAGFAMYAWQRVWKLPTLIMGEASIPWRPAGEADWPAVQSLHGQIVPVLLQPVESLPRQAGGLVCWQEGILQAHLGVENGRQGIWLQPIVPPDAGCGPEKLAGLAGLVPGWGSRPAYVCVRSYQAWLEAALEELGAEAGPRQAVMVRRLVAPLKEKQTSPALEQALAKVKPASPAAHSEGKR
jgi:hypothetical protein